MLVVAAQANFKAWLLEFKIEIIDFWFDTYTGNVSESLTALGLYKFGKRSNYMNSYRRKNDSISLDKLP